ncbi:hypothetical protein C0993_011479, partial [Termitomyces sp. T159_Od127]
MGFTPKFTSAPPPINTSASASSSTATPSSASVAPTTILESRTTIIACSNDILASASEPDVSPAASPRTIIEVAPATTSSTTISSSATPTDDRSPCITTVVPSDTTRRRPRPLRREGACIFQNVSGQVVPVPLHIPVAPTIVSYAPPIFFPPAFNITAPPPTLVSVTSATIPFSPVSDTDSHLLPHDIPGPGSPAPSSASSKRSWDEVDFDDYEDDAV